MKIIRKKDTAIADRGGHIVREIGFIDFPRDIRDAVMFETTLPRGTNFTEQWHEQSSELIYFQSRGSVQVDGNRYDFKRGDILHLKPGEKHKLIAEKNDLHVIAIRFPNLPNDKYTTCES